MQWLCVSNWGLIIINTFKKKIIITGYKSVLLKEFIEENNFKEVKNKNFKKTNMVYSAFKCCKIIKSDVVICYSDIIFDHKIYFNLKKKKNIIPLKENWLDIWKQRMSLKEIKKDAEYVEVKHNKLISIGETIKKKMPKYQYMGLIKLKYLEYQKLSKTTSNDVEVVDEEKELMDKIKETFGVDLDALEKYIKLLLANPNSLPAKIKKAQNEEDFPAVLNNIESLIDNNPSSL